MTPCGRPVPKCRCADIMNNQASPHMLAAMAASADTIFSTMSWQLLRILAAAEVVAEAGGIQLPSCGAKYAVNVLLQVRGRGWQGLL